MVLSVADEQGTVVPGNRGGAKTLLLTVLGEFVLPAGGSAWTSSLVAAANVVGIAEKNARQAIARTGEQGIISSTRHGRRVRWTLTPAGRRLLEDGADRIYRLGADATDGSVDWNGDWLVVHCPVAEAKRSVRTRLRTQLAFLGFGEVSANLLISPRVETEPALRSVLDDLGVLDECLVLRSTVASGDERARMVASAWDLDGLAAGYDGFQRTYRDLAPSDEVAAFRDTVLLVNDWRRFPFIDPGLPAELLPDGWVGRAAAETFRSRRQDWAEQAQGWFNRLESTG
ncbi:MAG: PaaX family transcriptional regulator C-terminal domain-containing protein [Actinomycetota bacterium]